MRLLEISKLSVAYETRYGRLRALDKINLALDQREFVAVVGESGSGKSTLGLAVVRLLPTGSSYEGGTIELEGKSILDMNQQQIRSVRGRTVFMIFQDPLTSLNPVKKVGRQLLEALRMRPQNREEVLQERNQEIVSKLKAVRIPDPEAISERYPHQLSGGQIQRVLIAMGLLMKPKLLIADEPTSAVDVTVQAQILKLLDDLKREYEMSLLFITHDISVAYNVADRIVVMYAGKVVETGPTDTVIKSPRHPYTIGLITSMPRGIGRKDKLQAIQGAPASLLNPPKGCRYHPRCPFVLEVCKRSEPEFYSSGESLVACWLYNKDKSSEVSNVNGIQKSHGVEREFSDVKH